MRDIQQLFYEKIILIQKLSMDFNFRACSGSSTDLITAAVLFEYQDGVFIGEVFEGVFDQLHDLVSRYDLDESDQKILKENFDRNLSMIAELFRKSDKNELYQALSNLRYETTKMQYKCYQTQKMKRREKISPFDEV